MKTLRKYNSPPFRVAVIHGGPGGPGQMAPVARELSRKMGVLEPLQTADSVEGQLLELKNQLESAAQTPVSLVGFSWGAMLGYMLTARFPQLVKKLILVCSAVFDQKYAEGILKIRLERLTEAQQEEAFALMEALQDPYRSGKDDLFGKLVELYLRADVYDPLPVDTEILEHQYQLNQKVWGEAKTIRDSGRLLKMGKRIRCPVVAIHGDYDPHPAEGIRMPLRAILKDFRFYLLPRCGHVPWAEREAREEFFTLLMRELRE